jgi:hypothetical protein
MSDELVETCERARRYARAHPITDATMNMANYRPRIFEPYCFKVTDQYSCMVLYETFARGDLKMQPPLWHVQVAVMENIGALTLDAVQLALVSVKDWTPEEVKVAKEIMGEVIAPEVVRHDQAIHVHFGLWDIHHFTPDVRGADVSVHN